MSQGIQETVMTIVIATLLVGAVVVFIVAPICIHNSDVEGEVFYNMPWPLLAVYGFGIIPVGGALLLIGFGLLTYFIKKTT